MSTTTLPALPDGAELLEDITPRAPLTGTAFVAPPNDPAGVTRFYGPVLSGKTNPGMALLAKRVSIDASQGGSFNALVNFPRNAILLWVGTSTSLAFSPAGGQVSIGITSGGAEIAAAAAPAAGTVLTAPLLGTLPLGQAWFNYTAGGSTAGKATVFLIYLWPMPAGSEVG